MTRPVALVGFASSSRDQAPFADTNFEIWTMNHAPLSWIPRWDVLFELHSLEHLKSIAAHSTQPSEYMDWLAKQPGPGAEGHRPIYMQERFDSIPASVGLPREELNALFGARAGNAKGFFAPDYYTSTISYMMAIAILQGREEIHLYGIDLLQEEEYFYQRAGAEYLVGFARGMGIKVYIPEQSAMCKANYVYGFSSPLEFGQLSPLVDFITDKANVSDTHVARAKQDAHTFNGAIQMADLVLGWIGEGKDLPAEVKAKKEDMEKRFKAAEIATQTMTGQAEAFRTCGVWAKHYARGGALKS